MNDVQSFLCCTGIMFIFYCVARLSHSIELYLEDKNTHIFFQKVLVIISFIFYLFSLYVAILIYFLQKYPNSRRIKFEIQEDRKSQEKYWRSEIRIAVDKERRKSSMKS